MKAIINVTLLLFVLITGAAAATTAAARANAFSANAFSTDAFSTDAARLTAVQTDSAGTGSALRPDSSVVHGRIPSPESLEALKTDKAFSYLQSPLAVSSWWERFWIWLGQQFARGLGSGEALSFWSLLFTRIIPWLVALLAIVLVTMKLLGIDTDALLRKKAITSDVLAAAAEQDLVREDLDKLLEESLRRGDLRLAIRLYYLDSLRRLSRAGLIEWHPDKTNRQYLGELNNKHLRERFGRLTRVFEYVWYGETEPGPGEFEAAREEFQALKGTLATSSNEKN